MTEQVPLWQSAVDGKPGLPAIYAGYQSAVDWPGVAFMPELAARFSEAKFILSVREAQGWADSFSQAIQKLMSDQVPVPPGWEDWLVIAKAANVRSGIKPEMDKAALVAAFKAHTDRVKATIPPSQLLIFEVRQGWGPLCDFLGVATPDTPFPRRNDRVTFWEEGEKHAAGIDGGAAGAFPGLTQNGLPALTRRQGFEGRISGPPVGERPTRLLDAARRQARALSHSNCW